MALELASYDLMPSEVPGFAKGFTAALFATSLCYPLDTVRWVTSMLLSCSSLVLYQILYQRHYDCTHPAHLKYSFRAVASCSSRPHVAGNTCTTKMHCPTPF